MMIMMVVMMMMMIVLMKMVIRMRNLFRDLYVTSIARGTVVAFRSRLQKRN